MISKEDGRLFQVQMQRMDEARSWFLDEWVEGEGKLLVLTPCEPLFHLLAALDEARTQQGRDMYADLHETLETWCPESTRLMECLSSERLEIFCDVKG